MDDRNKIESYKDLVVWQRSIDLVVEIYTLASHFPDSQKYTLTSQMQRSAISIPSNIAEGSRRGSKKDFQHFLRIAFGSASELETQLLLSKRLNFSTEAESLKAENILEEILKMLNKFVRSLD